MILLLDFYVGRRDPVRRHYFWIYCNQYGEKKFDLIVIVSPTFALQKMSKQITDGRGIIVFSEFRRCIIDEIEAMQEAKILEKEKNRG